jgi:hypothetical protein
LSVSDEEHVERALDMMAAENVGFDDAYLSVWATGREESVGSFDRDCRRILA